MKLTRFETKLNYILKNMETKVIIKNQCYQFVKDMYRNDILIGNQDCI
jgi:hypothetical protein